MIIPLEEVKKTQMMLALANIKNGDVMTATELIYRSVTEIGRDLRNSIKQGDVGPKGEKGDAGMSIVGPVGPKGDSIVGPRGPEGKPGVGSRGLIGKDGANGLPGVGLPGLQGKDGSPDTGKQIADKLNTLTGVIDASVIKNLPTVVETRSLPNISIFGRQGGGSGVQTIKAGANVTVTHSDSGAYTVSVPVTAFDPAAWRMTYNGTMVAV